MPDFRTVVDGVVTDLGTTVTLVDSTAGTYNAYGDRSEGTTTTDYTAVVQTLSQEDELVKEGEYQSGDIIFYFNSSNGSIVTRGDRVRHNSKEYKVHNVVPYEVSGNVQVYEIRTKVWE